VTGCRSGSPAMRRVLEWLALLSLCAVAVLPLLRSQSPCTHDGDFHYFRVVAMRRALEQGLLFTRWLPDLAFGYGYPFLNYRAALSYYVALGLYLVGLPLPLALNLVYVLSILGCALGAYLLARDLFGPQAAVVAAVAYAYAPYQFLDALLRANAPESVALALLPLVLWAFRRLVLVGGRRWFLLSAGLLTALLLTHNISSMLFMPFLLAYLLLLGWAYRWRGAWARVALALGLALGLTAFFWLPALAEQGYVQLHMSRVTRNNDFHYNFLALREVFAPPAPVDTSLMNPPMEIHLGLVQAVLAGMGLVVGWLRSGARPGSVQEADVRREWRGSLAFLALSSALFIFMTTPASLWLWENVPLLSFVQFPWRFVGRAALPVAVLCGALFASVSVPRNSQLPARNSRLTPVLLPLAACGLILASLPSSYPPRGICPREARPAVTDVHQYERESGLVGVDPEGSYFPAWVEERPEESPLEGLYTDGEAVARFDASTLPEGAAVLEAEYGPNRARLEVASPRPFRALYRSFYFPGWRVWVDGEPVEVAPTDPAGLISFDLPAGRHVVTVRFGETTLRMVADAVSVISLLVLVVVAIQSPRAEAQRSPFPAWASIWPLFLVALLLLALKLAVVDRVETPFRRPLLRAGGVLPGVVHPLGQSYADGLTLIGYDTSTTEMPADGTLRADLYWTARERPSNRYQTTVYLVGADGFLWSPQNSYRPRGYHRPPQTDTWTPGRYALDSHEVEPLPGTPPGTYRVVLTMFDRDTMVPLSVLNEAGQPAAPDLTLGEVTLTRPRRPAELPSRDRLDLAMDPFTLLTADFGPGRAAPGDAVHLDLLWQYAGAATSAPYTAALSLVAPDGSAAASYALSLPGPSWEEGDVWRGQHRLTLPVTLETASYTWTLRLAGSPGYGLGALSVTAPERSFTPPLLDHPLGVSLGDVATLVGATVEPGLQDLEPGTPLMVTLVWRAENTASVSHRVFLHLLDPEGRLVAQSDGVPANWTRPTTGWLPGEYIVDERVLDLPADAPAGDYAILAGLYVPGGGRLVAPDGADAVPIASLAVDGR
jgi:hypothetical protein